MAQTLKVLLGALLALVCLGGAAQATTLCSSPTEYVFVMDVSGSVSDAQYNQERSFVLNWINTVDPTTSTFAGNHFTCDVFVVRSSPVDKTTALADWNIARKGSGTTGIGKAIDAAKSYFSSTAGTSRVMIVLTDGAENCGTPALAAAAATVKNAGIKLVTIGIGSGNNAALTSAASPGLSFGVADFNGLAAALNNIITAACPASITCKAPQTITSCTPATLYATQAAGIADLAADLSPSGATVTADTVLTQPFPFGTTTVTLTATNGNQQATCTTSVTVNPCPPTITCSTLPPTTSCAPVPLFTSQAQGIAALTASSTPSAATITADRDLAGPFNFGTTTITLTATYEGMTASCTTDIVVDSCPPTITCQDQEVTSCDPVTIPISHLVTSSAPADAVVTPDTIAAFEHDTTTGTAKTTTVTFTATFNGKTATCDSKVTVNPCDFKITCKDVSTSTCKAFAVTQDQLINTLTSVAGSPSVSISPALPASLNPGQSASYTLAAAYRGLSSSCTAQVTNDACAPKCDSATVTPTTLWSPNHKFQEISITVPDGNTPALPVTVAVTAIRQNQPTLDKGSGNTCIDGTLSPVAVRAERTGVPGFEGRYYQLSYTATNSAGKQCTAKAYVCVPHDQSRAACPAPADSIFTYDSTKCTDVPAAYRRML